MSTAIATATNSNTGAVSQEKVTYRRYVILGTEESGPNAGRSVISKERILAETDAKAKSGLSVNWQKAEDEGYTLLSENEVITYDVKSEEGTASLIPDAIQRLYVFNIGLSSLQTARANAIMKALKEGAAEPTPEFNQQTIDLRVGVGEDGDYSINKAPSRKSMSDMDKLIKMLDAMGVAPDKRDGVLAALLAAQASSAEVAEEAAAVQEVASA
jgi:hypothetical protein